MLFFFFTLGSIEDDEGDCFQRDQRACKRNATDAHQHRRMQSLDCTRFSASQAQLDSSTIHCSTGAVAIPPPPPTFESYSLSLF